MTVLIGIGKAILRFLREADMVLLALSIISSVYGIILISSSTANLGEEGVIIVRVGVQVGALIIGLALFVLFSYIDIDIIADKSVLLLIFSLLFVATLYFWGTGAHERGNNAWLRFWGIGVQPAEVVKIPFAIIIAKMIVNFKEQRTLNSILSLAQILIVFGMFFGLIIWVSSDLGSAIIFAFILAVMLYIGDLKLRWFIIGTAIIAAVSPLLWNLLEPYQQIRIVAPFFPEEYDPDRQGILWQANQSAKAIASGGFYGQGLGQGRITQARNGIPEQHTDFIFSVAGEELGLIGCLVIIGLLFAIIVRCFQVGIRSNNPLGLLVCTGLAAKFIAQTIENIGMCLEILPVIGITLPFFSYGGSSLVTCFAAMGIISGVKMRPKPIRFRNL